MVLQWLENNGVCEQSKKKKERGNEECLLWEKKMIVLSLTHSVYMYTYTTIGRRKKYLDYYSSTREVR